MAWRARVSPLELCWINLRIWKEECNAAIHGVIKLETIHWFGWPENCKSLQNHNSHHIIFTTNYLILSGLSNLGPLGILGSILESTKIYKHISTLKSICFVGPSLSQTYAQLKPAVRWTNKAVLRRRGRAAWNRATPPTNRRQEGCTTTVVPHSSWLHSALSWWQVSEWRCNKMLLQRDSVTVTHTWQLAKVSL